jgi:hypothetical protein
VPVFDLPLPDVGLPAGSSSLACSEFQHCSSFDGNGVEYTGDNGFTVNLCTLEQLPWRLRNTPTVPHV